MERPRSSKSNECLWDGEEVGLLWSKKEGFDSVLSYFFKKKKKITMKKRDLKSIV